MGAGIPMPLHLVGGPGELKQSTNLFKYLWERVEAAEGDVSRI